jgi:hypothetical protein
MGPDEVPADFKLELRADRGNLPRHPPDGLQISPNPLTYDNVYVLPLPTVQVPYSALV